MLGLAVGVTAAVVAWGFLVWSAIDFGISARSGESNAWWFLALASVGAMACLFVALMLVARIARTLGITSPVGSADAPTEPANGGSPTVAAGSEPETPAERPSIRPGGHRAKR